MPRIRRIYACYLAATASLIVLGWWWNSRRTETPIAISAIASRTSDSEATSWPQFRGPTHDAISLETGLADSWPEVGPPVVWTRELGQGYSSFVAVGNRVFTQTQSLYQQSVICLNSESGDTVWSHQYGWPFDGGGLYPGPRSTPTWHDGRIYFASPNGMLGCLDANDGHLFWSCNPKKTHHGRGTDFGYASSPVIVDGRVIVPVGGLDDASVVAIDIRDGSTVWTAGEASASYATPLPIRWRNRSVAIVPLENSIAAFDLDVGKQMWEIEFSQGYDEHSAAPLYREPFLVVASPFRAGAKCYRLVDDVKASTVEEAREKPRPVPDEGNVPGTPVVVWDSPKFSNDVSSSVLVDGRLYGFDLKDPQSRLDRPSRGEFRCLDFQTGRIIWSTSKVGQASVIVADKKLILFTDSGELVLARSGTDEYVELARTQVFRDEVCWTSPALHRGCVYVRTQTRAACLYLGASPFISQRPAQLVTDIPQARVFDARWLIGGEREYPATVPDWREFGFWYQWSVGGMILAMIVALLARLAVKVFHRLRRGLGFAKRGIRRPENTGDRPTAADLVKEPGGKLIVDSSFSNALERTLFWLSSILVGVFGSPLINSLQSEYVLLWPLAIWTAFQLTINAITATERRSNRRQLRWLTRCCGLLFVGTCALYFSLCRALGYAIEWSFLVGFLPAFVVAAFAARFLTTTSRYWPLTDLIFSIVSFTAYFWFSVGFIKWKLVVGS